MATRGRTYRRAAPAVRRGACALVALVCAAAGCDVGTPPSPPAPSTALDVLGYYPDAALVAVPCGDHEDFSVRAGGQDLRSLVWSTTSGQSGRGPRFRYFASTWLPDTLEVLVTASGGTRSHRWAIDTLGGLAETGFEPDVDEVTLFWSTEQPFAVATACDPLAVAWEEDGAAAGDGEDYVFFAETPGNHSVRVRVSLPDTVVTRAWTVRVQDPGDEFRYEPAQRELEIYESMNQFFAVIADAPLPDVVWTVDGAEAGTGTRFGFPGYAPGTYEIAVAVTLPGTVVRRTWILDVVPAEQGAPPPVAGLTVVGGAEFGSFEVSWPASEPGPFGLEAYELRWSAAGPLTPANWLNATPVGTGVWMAGEPAYSQMLWYDEMNWATGDQVWFAVRARDERGFYSDITESPRLHVNIDWWVEGRIVGPDGAPAADVRVRDHDTGRDALTGADGRYRVGPFVPLDVVLLETSGVDAVSGAPWSPQVRDQLVWNGTRTQDYLLIPDLGTDASCFMFHGNFTRYLRLMTMTFQMLADRQDHNLYKWNSYPVDVYVPEWTSPRTGIDFGAAGRFAVAVWNDSMGEEYLRLVDAPPAVGIELRFGIEDPVAAARSRMLQPGDGDLRLATAVPELVAVEFTDIFPTETRLRETAIHEFGHCLGLYYHSYCPETRYVMNTSSAGALDEGPENAIHPDERAAVRMIRALPQGLDMSPYSME